jgi:LysM repeat protein
MHVRHVATVALVVSLGLASGLAWAASAPHARTTGPAKTYVVHAGDGGWWRVAQAHGVSLPQLLAANHATSATPLRVGQSVNLPPPAHDPAKAASRAKSTPIKAPAKSPPHPATATHSAWPNH